jgi:SsrA-binding protein
MANKELKEKNIATNRKAFRDYEILDRREAGIELLGTEVKSLRAGRINISDSYAVIEEGQVYLMNLHIPPYESSGKDGHDPYRRRRLLLHKREIRRLFIATAEKGLTLVPLRFYFRGPYVKVELATARGRRKYDKRDIIARKEAQRSMERARRQERKQ